MSGIELGSIGVVDVHAHFFPPVHALPSWVGTDLRAPRLELDDSGSGRIMLGATVFRRVRQELWDVTSRVQALGEAGVAAQVISPVPVMLGYDEDGSRGHDYARACNDATAEAVALASGRLVGLGALPLADVGASVSELHRLVSDLGLAGVEIGAQIGGRELDDPSLAPIFAAAEQLGCVIFVHPMDGGHGTIRRKGQPYEFGLGMMTDTALAASALVFGGVLDRHPDLRVALAHGCGTFPWALPRLAKGSEIFGGRPAGSLAEVVRRLWVDSLVFDPQHLGLLVERFGPDHVMFGSDYPFFPGLLEDASGFVDGAVQSQTLNAGDVAGILGGNARTFVGGALERTGTV